jgi:hypothetical protein
MGAISAFYVRRFLLEKKVRLERLAVVQEATDREVRYLREGEEKTLSGFRRPGGSP